MHFSTFSASEPHPTISPCQYAHTAISQSQYILLQIKLATQYILLQINAFKYQIHSIQHPSANNAAYFASVYIIRLE
ncbi:hypothetical protein LTSEJOH_0142 [Salmonella enterica subsp. enterica serovar Johannesburg str. S5-703]|nr:hypothetical protein LTSEJOH_0142 [Salmonella enterica subsp. enterica serovar Johannesburg str. S5-703]